jgi:uncharacterized phiE125 gp8 family phage protein
MLTETIPSQFTTIVETEPTYEPVTLTEAKTYLRVDTTEDDTLITGLIKTARKICENLSNRYFHQRTITQKQTGGIEIIDFMRSPVTTVSSVTFIQSTDASPESFTDFYHTTEKMFSTSQNTKFSVGRLGDGYTIQYTAGIVADATPSTLSTDIKTAILRVLGYLYENRIEGTKNTSEQGFSITYEQSMDIQKILNPISNARSFF